ncbi:MAG TPA: DHH family phosphoesterase [Verrucomicrobiae bacterium]|nr:DHH family phosphoesterase [Verrucomicrobiae bacterium]
MALNAQQQAVELIGRAKNILLTTREQASIDSIASVTALALVLKKLNKSFDIVVPDFDAKQVPSFLPSVEIRSAPGSMRSFKIKLNVKDVPLSELMYDVKDGQLEITIVPKKNSWKPNDVSFASGDDRYDLVIAVDAPDMASLGALFREQADFLYRTTIINLDHNAANEYWGQVNVVDLNCVSTTEALYQFLKDWNTNQIDADIATAVLAGMIAKTRSFRTTDVTPKTLAAASHLVELGARRADIVQGLWRTQTVSTLKLWGRALTHLRQDRELGLVWATLTQRDFLETGAKPEQLDGVVEELIGASPEAKIVALLSPAGNGTHVSLHAKPPFDAADIARAFSGTGNRERATFTWDGPGSIAEDEQAVIEKIKRVLQGA